MKRVLHIEVSSLEGSLQQFGEALEAVMRGEERERGWIWELYPASGHANAEALGAHRAPEAGGTADGLCPGQALGRDYKNVHTDVKALEDLGIIERDSEGRVTVPWDEVEMKVPLAAWFRGKGVGDRWDSFLCDSDPFYEIIVFYPLLFTIIHVMISISV
jgi:hypothetical protein